MAEEHRCQASEGHRLCANNCGFFGSPTTMNLCSKCYRDLQHTRSSSSSSKSSIEIALSPVSSTSLSPPPPSSYPSETEALPTPPALTLPEVAVDTVSPAVVGGGDDMAEASRPNRCLVCKRRTGLTGFRCRCGTTFCGIHRYPEKHGCTFDFKTVGREEIARANPVVRADKLEKI
ncbi:zinc finger A20 and AN1 domain-containing stress-associated protein 4 [Juglans regia]|uniref:Zinc finger A20 and AN1 domain-containing stress-associated protein 4 n=1 Tax=Juglans regia TaxID=51240 RepID=A0A2I4DKT0_JUGRE|nr:zinc finger A20 and AN1 domain-containing stress-associated protein 4 [Juglans regia]